MKEDLQTSLNKMKLQFNSKIIICFLLLLLLFIICVVHAIPEARSVDFIPINGTFQNYNPIRRLLAGQIPYKDFQDYLGMGHLYAGTIATFIFGGDFQASLVAFCFLSFLSIAMISIVLGKAIFGKWDIALGTTNIVLIMLLNRTLFFADGVAIFEEITKALNASLTSGNSARFIRGMGLPVCCFLVLVGEKIYHVLKSREWKITRNRNIFVILGVGVLSGITFLWSNDYGISCWVCISIMTFCISFSRTRKLKISIIYTIIEILCSIASLMISAEIFTLGHLKEWINATFGTGGYQAWYYNSAKSYYLWDADFSWLMLMQAFLSFFYLCMIYKKNATSETIKRYGIPAFANMVCFCAVNEYKLLSGNSMKEVALSVFFITVFFEIIHIIIIYTDKKKMRKIITIMSIFVSISWIIPTIKEEILYWKLGEPKGTYIEELGGYNTKLAGSLLEADEFLAGERMFATYASGQEAVSGFYQPSGTDYIIHVLGDEQREKYLASFEKDNFKYAVTIKESCSLFEFWVQRANWFFYRELYKGWHPVYANEYETYWERNNVQYNGVKADIQVEIVDIDHARKKIVVKTDDNINGIADVYLDYKVSKNDNLSANFLFRKELLVENTGAVISVDEWFETNRLRDESQEYIPITIVNGYGEVTLTSCPDRSTDLEVNGASCTDIFTGYFDYVEIEEMVKNEDILDVYVSDNIRNNISLKDANKFVINNQEYSILEILEADEQICISLDITNKESSIMAMKNFDNIAKILKYN